MTLPKKIPLADTIHHRPCYPSWSKPPCGAMAEHSPRNYSFDWKDVTCLACEAWYEERATRQLRERVHRLEQRIEAEVKLLAELREQLAARDASRS